MIMSTIEEQDDNPVWTRQDFARANGPEHLPPEMLAAFPNTIARLAREQALGVPVVMQVVQLQSAGFRIDRLAA